MRKKNKKEKELTKRSLGALFGSLLGNPFLIDLTDSDLRDTSERERSRKREIERERDL